MKQYIFFIFFFFFSVCKLFANDSIAVNLSNQYKKGIGNTTFIINNSACITDKEGNVTISILAADSVTITNKGYEEKTISIKDISSLNKVILNKKFTWTDLLTPMFYIIYGGLWLLLVIIFAETGLFVGFFFPGDSLLFVAGILSTPLVDSISLNTGSDFLNLLIIAALCTLAGILGNTVGYITGLKLSLIHI